MSNENKPPSEQITLDAHDEEILDAVWDMIADEEAMAHQRLASVAQKDYHAVKEPEALAHGAGHWITTHTGAHVFIKNEPGPNNPRDADNDDRYFARDVTAKVMSGLSKDEQHEFQTAIDDFTQDPTNPGAERLRAVAAKLWGGTIYMQDGKALSAEAITAIAHDHRGRLLSKAVRLQYEETQRILQGRYPSGYIKLYRGVSNDRGEIGPTDYLADVKSNSLESWTTDKARGAHFARWGQHGVEFEANIPITSVWASYLTHGDLANMGEFEVMVLGNTKEFRAKVIYYH